MNRGGLVKVLRFCRIRSLGPKFVRLFSPHLSSSPRPEITYEFGDMGCPCGRGRKEDDPLGEPDWSMGGKRLRKIKTPRFVWNLSLSGYGTLLPNVQRKVLDFAWEKISHLGKRNAKYFLIIKKS